MKFHSSHNGFDLFETVSEQASTFVIIMDTPDGNIPVGRGYNSVEEAHQAIAKGWRPVDSYQQENFLKRTLKAFAK